MNFIFYCWNIDSRTQFAKPIFWSLSYYVFLFQFLTWLVVRKRAKSRLFGMCKDKYNSSLLESLKLQYSFSLDNFCKSDDHNWSSQSLYNSMYEDLSSNLVQWWWLIYLYIALHQLMFLAMYHIIQVKTTKMALSYYCHNSRKKLK